MEQNMQPENYQSYLRQIRYCKQYSQLSGIVQNILQSTGFGANQGADVEDMHVVLDYAEIAVCLKETDQRFFQKEIELLIFAHQQVTHIKTGQVPDEPEAVPTWQMFT